MGLNRAILWQALNEICTLSYVARGEVGNLSSKKRTDADLKVLVNLHTYKIQVQIDKILYLLRGEDHG